MGLETIITLSAIGIGSVLGGGISYLTARYSSEDIDINVYKTAYRKLQEDEENTYDRYGLKVNGTPSINKYLPLGRKMRASGIITLLSLGYCALAGIASTILTQSTENAKMTGLSSSFFTFLSSMAFESVGRKAREIDYLKEQLKVLEGHYNDCLTTEYETLKQDLSIYANALRKKHNNYAKPVILFTQKVKQLEGEQIEDAGAGVEATGVQYLRSVPDRHASPE